MLNALLPVPHCPNCIHMHAHRAYVIVARDGNKIGIHLPSYNSSIFYLLNASLEPLPCASYLVVWPISWMILH